MKIRAVAPALALAILLPHVVFGQNQPLSLEQALERARRRAPLILAAQDRIEEARGRLIGARVLLRDNPALSESRPEGVAPPLRSCPVRRARRQGCSAPPGNRLGYR